MTFGEVPRTRHVFFAAAPMHLICIYELKQTLSRYDYDLILFRSNHDHANIQINNTLNLLGLNQTMEYFISDNPLIKFFRVTVLVRRLSQKYKKQRVLFTLFDFRNTIMHMIRDRFHGQDFILLDDGFYTCVAYEKFIKHGIFYPLEEKSGGWRKAILRYLCFGDRIERLMATPVGIFSLFYDFFDEPKPQGAKNNLTGLRALLGVAAKIVDEDTVIFIGTKLSERKAMSIEDELLCMNWVREYWAKRNKRLIYVGKRSSSSLKLNQIEKIGIKVISFDLPLEVALSSLEKLPCAICSTGSTLLTTLPMIYGSIEYYFCDFTKYYRNVADRAIFELSKKHGNMSPNSTLTVP